MSSNFRFPSYSGMSISLGFVFLYLPIVILIFYSFNASERVNVWAGFSLRWYKELFHNEAIMSAVSISFKLAFATASMALILGTMASIALTRLPNFPGRYLFIAMITAPLVMPDVITGLSLLLLFVNMNEGTGWPASRGSMTIWIAHVTFCMAFVTVIMSSRLRDLDNTLEDAARDLGASRFSTFYTITLPVIFPALVSAWLLSFSLSLDDLVIASFVSGPDSTTLPMVVFSSVRMGLSPEINALASIMVAIVVLVSLMSYFLLRKKS